MLIKDEIWILADDRPGTFSQSIGLAEEIGLQYKIITLTYSFFTNLPNYFLSDSLLRITGDLRKKFADFDYLPKVIISAGRRSAPIALHLKNQSQRRAKIIQIMNPNCDFKKFDFIILPKHDEAREAKNLRPLSLRDTASWHKPCPALRGTPSLMSMGHKENLITTIGSLSKINDKIISDAGEKFRQKFPDLKKATIALLIGGPSKKTSFDKSNAVDLAKIAARVAKNMNATLLVLTSRRTGAALTQAVEENLNCDFKMFDWQNLGSENPYLGIVGFADFFIVTGDSVSMISECASTGKPVYIFDEKNISTPKHQRFHQNLFAENYARKLSAEAEILEKFSQKKLQETQRVALIIKNKLNLANPFNLAA